MANGRTLLTSLDLSPENIEDDKSWGTRDIIVVILLLAMVSYVVANSFLYPYFFPYKDKKRKQVEKAVKKLSKKERQMKSCE
mmetsp:Transcript_43438/g.77969  ORF Transcript_43438/g.77969 Transcript_43438/m.77969 type:complete len:82 (-) Transcript_43438:78-323(-)